MNRRQFSIKSALGLMAMTAAGSAAIAMAPTKHVVHYMRFRTTTDFFNRPITSAAYMLTDTVELNDDQYKRWQALMNKTPDKFLFTPNSEFGFIIQEATGCRPDPLMVVGVTPLQIDFFHNIAGLKEVHTTTFTSNGIESREKGKLKKVTRYLAPTKDRSGHIMSVEYRDNMEISNTKILPPYES